MAASSALVVGNSLRLMGFDKAEASGRSPARG